MKFTVKINRKMFAIVSISIQANFNDTFKLTVNHNNA